MRMILHPADLNLRQTFRTTHESRDLMPTLIVELQDEESGLSGYGEAAQIRYYGVLRENTMAVLERARERIEHTPLETPQQYLRLLDDLFNGHPFARCAVDVAAHDLWARRRGQRLIDIWSPGFGRTVPTCYTIGMSSVDEMVEKMRAMPWPVYKIKLGTDDDLDIVRALREHTDATFRVDANTAWTVAQTEALAPKMAALGVEFLEQPLPADEPEGYRYLYERCALPLMADESCHVEADVDRCAGHFHAINIKVMKCGGLLPARRMISRARHHGMKVMVGCMTESSVGISAIAQLLPELDYADMDGALLIANDPATGVTFDREGIAQFPDRPGTGVVMNERVEG